MSVPPAQRLVFGTGSARSILFASHRTTGIHATTLGFSFEVPVPALPSSGTSTSTAGGRPQTGAAGSQHVSLHSDLKVTSQPPFPLHAASVTMNRYHLHQSKGVDRVYFLLLKTGLFWEMRKGLSSIQTARYFFGKLRATANLNPAPELQPGCGSLPPACQRWWHCAV